MTYGQMDQETDQNKHIYISDWNILAHHVIKSCRALWGPSASVGGLWPLLGAPVPFQNIQQVKEFGI